MGCDHRARGHARIHRGHRIVTLVVVIVAVAALIRAVLGFGEALIAVPLLAFVLPVQTIAPLATLVSMTVALVFLITDWRDVHLGSAARLLAPTIAGIPIGVWTLTHVDETIVKSVLALLIGSFSAYSLISVKPPALRDDRTAPMFGFAAGIMGGAYGMNGPAIAMFGTLRRWPAREFRATLQAYFLPASGAGLIGFWLSGLWTSDVTSYYATALPAIIAATLAGRALHQRFHGRRFVVAVHTALIFVAATLLWQAATAPRDLLSSNIR
jgi:uncharacterized protein